MASLFSLRPWSIIPLVTALILAALCVSDSCAAQKTTKADENPQPDKAKAAEDSLAPQGRLVRVPLPIKSATANQVIATILRARDSMPKSAKKRVIVLEIIPRSGSEFGLGSDWVDALKLASFLDREMEGVQTVAYIPRPIRGHGVLVAAACDEIVMSKDAEIGDAGADEPADQPIDPLVANNYSTIAKSKLTLPEPVVLGMLNPDLEILKVVTDVSTEYMLPEELEDKRKERTIVSSETLIGPGEMGRFTGTEARKQLGVKYLANNRRDLAKAMGLAPDALKDDPSLVSEWKPIKIRVRGTIDFMKAKSVLRMIQRQIDLEQVNFVLLEIDSTGGRLEDAMLLADYLGSLDPGQVRVVGFVNKEASGSAALVALACHQMVMDAEGIVGGTISEPLDQETVKLTQIAIKEWGPIKDKTRTWSLPAAFIDPNLQVFRYEHNDSGEVQYFSLAELAEQPDPDAWTQGEMVTTEGLTLEVDAIQAKKLGLAWDSVHDFEELKESYGLEEDPRVVEPGWAEHLVQALASPGVAVLLLMIGFVAIYAELQMPGIGVGGFVASLAFLLFFWSRWLNESAGWLEAVLFVGGICFLLLEIFVLPGFGIFGLGGGLMVLASLVLASQTSNIPRTAADIDNLRQSVMVVCGAAIGAVVIAAILRRYLPHTPLFNRIMLEPPNPEQQAEREAIVDFEHLVGGKGETTTQLTPSGKATIEGEFLDVISEGELIERGERVVVVKVQGNRVIVRQDVDT